MHTRQVLLIVVLVVGGTSLPVQAQATRPAPGKASSSVFILGIAFSHDGSRLATCGDRVRVLEVESGKLLSEFESKLTRAVAFSPKDRNVVVVSGDGGIVRLFRVDQPGTVREFNGHEGNVAGLAFDPSGERFVTGSVLYRDGAAVKGQLRLWDVATGNVRNAIDLNDSGITAVAFSQDGSLIAYCAGRQVHVQRVVGWERVTSIKLDAGDKLENGPHGKSEPFGLATVFSQDNARLIVGGGICVPVSPEEAAPYKSACRTTGLIWSVALNDPDSIKLMEEPRLGYCFRLALTPDGQRFATPVERTNNRGNPDPKIELRDADTGKPIWRVDANGGSTYGFAMSPDGKLIANSVFGGINLRDAEKGKLLRSISLTPMP